MGKEVSFETAKKLRESGWAGTARAFYITNGTTAVLQISGQNYTAYEIDLSKPHEYYPAPTVEELGASEVDEVAKRYIK